MPGDAEKLLDLLTELWNTGKLDLVPRLYSKQLLRIDPNRPEATRGIQEVADYIAEVHTAFPDFKLEIRKSLIDGNHIASEWICSGTHQGVFQGIPATGRRVEVSGMTLNRFGGGQIVEEAVYFDRLGMLQQLGVIPGTVQNQSSAAAT